MSTTTADDFVAELGRTVKMVVTREVGPLREALAASEAANADLRQQLEEVRAAAEAALLGGAQEARMREFVTAAADDLRAEWAARDAERAADGEVIQAEWLTAESLVGALEPLRRSLEAIPPLPDLSEFATKDDVAGMLDFLQRDLAETLLPPEPRDWTPEIEAVRAAIPQPPDLSGFLDKGEGEAIRGLMVRETALIRAEMHDAIRAVELKEGPEGKAGKLPLVRAWADGVTYEGEVRTHAGATWQAQRDTGKPPSATNADWLCLADRGEDGAPATHYRICGTYDDGRDYRELNVVSLNGASFVAKWDDPGPCPGDGWQLQAKQGKKGDPGDKVKGDPGNPAPRPVALTVDEESAALTLRLEDGTALVADLYPLLEKVAK